MNGNAHAQQVYTYGCLFYKGLQRSEHDEVYLSQSHLKHGRQTQVLVEQRNGVLNQDTCTLVLVRKGPNHDSVDSLMWVLAAVEQYLGVRLSGDGKVRHLARAHAHVA